MEERKEIALQVTPIPPVVGTVVAAGYDPRDGTLRLFNLATFIEPLILAEKVHTLDRIDERDGIDVVIAAGVKKGGQISKPKEVPSGDVWFINRLQVICPAADATGSAKFNILIGPWGDKPYFATDVLAMGTTTNIDVTTAGHLGEELRLVGGDKITIVFEATEDFTVDKTFRFNLFGRKGKRLV